MRSGNQRENGEQNQRILAVCLAKLARIRVVFVAPCPCHEPSLFWYPACPRNLSAGRIEFEMARFHGRYRSPELCQRISPSGSGAKSPPPLRSRRSGKLCGSGRNGIPPNVVAGLMSGLSGSWPLRREFARRQITQRTVRTMVVVFLSMGRQCFGCLQAVELFE